MHRAAALLFVPLALLATACSGENAAHQVDSSACGELLYEGTGDPDVILVSDLPLRGIGGQTTRLMVDAIEYVLRGRKFRAGDHRVGYQSCNDTVGDEPFDEQRCRENARDYVAATDVVGIVGPWNSGCAVEQIPIVSRRAAGPLAMISPSNTFVSLTRTAADLGSPDLGLYPDGVRSYTRVVAHDLSQGAAAARLARTLGAQRVAIVQQDLSDSYVRGLATSFVRDANELALDVSRFPWRPRAGYASLAAAVAARRPDAVYLAGLTQVNADRLVRDLRAALGEDVPLIAPDSFAAEDIVDSLGPDGEGMYVTVPGIPHELLPPAGKRFVRDFGAAVVERGQLGAPEAAQATEVLLDAIARSDGTRRSVVEELFATKVEGGILGSFSFDRFGDIVPAAVGVYRFERGKIVAESVVQVPSTEE